MIKPVLLQTSLLMAMARPLFACRGRRSNFGSTPPLACRRTCSLSSRSSTRLRLGYLKPGDQLPKVRDVVASLAINPNTVLKAYRELEIKGLHRRPPGPGHVHPGDAQPGRASRADRAAPLPAHLAEHRRRGGTGRRRDRGAVHQRVAGFS